MVSDEELVVDDEEAPEPDDSEELDLDSDFESVEEPPFFAPEEDPLPLRA